MVKKKSKMFIRFDVIHERDRRTLRDGKDRAYASHRAVIKRTVSITCSAVFSYDIRIVIQTYST